MSQNFNILIVGKPINKTLDLSLEQSHAIKNKGVKNENDNNK